MQALQSPLISLHSVLTYCDILSSLETDIPISAFFSKCFFFLAIHFLSTTLSPFVFMGTPSYAENFSISVCFLRKWFLNSLAMWCVPLHALITPSDTFVWIIIRAFVNISSTMTQIARESKGQGNCHQKLPTYSGWVFPHQWKQWRQSPTDVEGPLLRLLSSWCLVVVDERFKLAITATISHFLKWQFSRNVSSCRQINFKVGLHFL